MSEIKLLNCPFCGGEAKVIENNQYTDIHSVMCKNCFAESDRYHTQEEAIKQWNTRKPMERIIERLEEEADKWRDTQKQDLDNGYNNRFACGMTMGLDNAIDIVKEVGGIE